MKKQKRTNDFSKLAEEMINDAVLWHRATMSLMFDSWDMCYRMIHVRYENLRQEQEKNKHD